MKTFYYNIIMHANWHYILVEDEDIGFIEIMF